MAGARAGAARQPQRPGAGARSPQPPRLQLERDPQGCALGTRSRPAPSGLVRAVLVDGGHDGGVAVPAPARVVRVLLHVVSELAGREQREVERLYREGDLPAVVLA